MSERTGSHRSSGTFSIIASVTIDETSVDEGGVCIVATGTSGRRATAVVAVRDAKVGRKEKAGSTDPDSVGLSLALLMRSWTEGVSITG